MFLTADNVESHVKTILMSVLVTVMLNVNKCDSLGDANNMRMFLKYFSTESGLQNLAFNSLINYTTWNINCNCLCILYTNTVNKPQNIISEVLTRPLNATKPWAVSHIYKLHFGDSLRSR